MFYEWTRSSYSMGFIYLSAKKIICIEAARYQPASLRKNLFQTSSFMYFALFSQNASQMRLLKRLWKCASKILSFRKYKQKVVLLALYLSNYDSFKPTFFMLNMASDVALVRVLSNKLEFFVSCNTKIARTSFFLLSLSVLVGTFL